MNESRPAENQIKVVGISGSLRNGSYTQMAAEIALQGAKGVGARTQLIDLRQYNLIFCDGKEDESSYPEDVFRLRKEVQQAQGIILATPEYHGSFSGVLKNAMDLMGFDEFEGKMIGLIGVAGGRMGAFSALNSLREIGRALHAWVIPEQASIPQAWDVFNEDGSMKEKDLENRVAEVGCQVTRYASLHTSQKAQEFLKTWECAAENPGAGD
ncbi:MAG: NAD(P)H-dependent oxidoreductase [bacterium]